MRTQSFGSLLIAVGREVIKDDHGSGFKFRHQNMFDVSCKSRTVHRASDDPRSDQSVLCQACNECLRAPAAKGCVHLQALTTWSAASQAGQVCFHGCFIHCPAGHRNAMSREG